MHQEPYLPAYLNQRATQLVAAAIASAASLDDEAIEQITQSLVADHIELGQPLYLEDPWVRRMSAGPENSIELVRRGIYAGQAYDVAYQRYQLPIVSGAEFVSVGVNGGMFLDPMFALRQGDHIEIRAADDRHRDELISKIKEKVEKANSTISSWNDTKPRPLVEKAAAVRIQQQASAADRRAQLEADGFAPANMGIDVRRTRASENQNDISIFINGGFAVDEDGRVQKSGSFPLEDHELASRTLARVVSFGGISGVRRRPGSHHVEVSPTNPQTKIRVTTPKGASDFSPIGLTVDELADRIAALIDGAHPNTVPIDDQVPENSELSTTAPLLADLHLSRKAGDRQAFRVSIEQVVAETQRLEELDAWSEGSPEFAKAQRRKRFLHDYMRFPADDDASEQAEADRMAMALEAQNLSALAGLEPSSGDLVDDLLPILKAAAEVDGSTSDGDIAREVAVASDAFLTEIIATAETVEDEELAELVTASEEDGGSLLQRSLAWTGTAASSAANRFGSPVPVSMGVATIITGLVVLGASAATVGPANGIAVGLLWSWLRSFSPSDTD